MNEPRVNVLPASQSDVAVVVLMSAGLGMWRPTMRRDEWKAPAVNDVTLPPVMLKVESLILPAAENVPRAVPAAFPMSVTRASSTSPARERAELPVTGNVAMRREVMRAEEGRVGEE